MDVEQTALELVERWYASRAGVMANGESRDLLIAAVAAALREARATGVEEPPRKHYAIIGGYTGKQIGCCWGERGKADVLEEEPRATFREMPQSECPVCNH